MFRKQRVLQSGLVSAAESLGSAMCHFFPSVSPPFQKLKEGELSAVAKIDEGAGGAGDVKKGRKV